MIDHIKLWLSKAHDGCEASLALVDLCGPCRGLLVTRALVGRQGWAAMRDMW